MTEPQAEESEESLRLSAGRLAGRPAPPAAYGFHAELLFPATSSQTFSVGVPRLPTSAPPGPLCGQKVVAANEKLFISVRLYDAAGTRSVLPAPGRRH